MSGKEYSSSLEAEWRLSAEFRRAVLSAEYVNAKLGKSTSDDVLEFVAEGGLLVVVPGTDQMYVWSDTVVDRTQVK